MNARLPEVGELETIEEQKAREARMRRRFLRQVEQTQRSQEHWRIVINTVEFTALVFLIVAVALEFEWAIYTAIVILLLYFAFFAFQLIQR